MNTQASSQLKTIEKIELPSIAAIHVHAGQVFYLSAEGELEMLSMDRARMLLHKKPLLVCHAPYARHKLGNLDFYAFDVLELLAFVHPAKFCVPTPHGLANILGLPMPKSAEDYPLTLIEIARTLLWDIQNDAHTSKAPALPIARVMDMAGKGWPWAQYVIAALGQSYQPEAIQTSRSALNIWKNLPEWAEEAPEPPPSHFGVTEQETQTQLEKIRGHDAEARSEQIEYSKIIAQAFATPAPETDPPHVVLAEAGTGVGKTLGYLAPASVWADKNKGTVWISTYTKNLQRQIDQELSRIYPNPIIKETHVAIRKGRENYLCLLNLEESAAAAATARSYQDAVAAGIMARWAAATPDGDLTGAHFPGWLVSLLGYANTIGLADRRGECIYAACDHYSRCFIEHSARKAERASIVVANHALVMISSAMNGGEEHLPRRYIFDEGHHLFQAADSAYAGHLTASETRDLRRWILGAEGGKASRARGLKRRLEDLAEGHAETEKSLLAILSAARVLTADGWRNRLKDNLPIGPCESFLFAVYRQVRARTTDINGFYSLEAELHPADSDVIDKAKKLKEALITLQKPMHRLAVLFKKRLAEDHGTMDSNTRKRMDSLAASLERRSQSDVLSWIMMLDDMIKNDTDKGSLFIDWLEIERQDGKDLDIGFYRHYIDPMKPFADSIRPHLHGMAITSATLRDGFDEKNWRTAEQRTSTIHLTPTPTKSFFNSPFDYKAQTKVLIINDVKKDDLNQVSGAYRTLFQSSQGGALGLFTAINRLKAVHDRIIIPLEQSGLTLYSQHIDEIDPGTLVDMFREDTHACLLGTDAVRDGVDVPGESLRLIVFDRVPWPRPTILHKARRTAFGGKAYDEMLTRLKLKQAFGRLIRRADDRGIFVMLDSALPSRLYDAFPEQVDIQKCGLGEAIKEINGFFGR